MPSFETIVIQFQQKESKILQNSEKVPKKTRKRRFPDTETESGKDKLTKNLRHAAVIAVVFRDIIGTRLYGIGRIFHGGTDGSGLDHRNIIFLISGSHGVGKRNLKKLAEFFSRHGPWKRVPGHARGNAGWSRTSKFFLLPTAPWQRGKRPFLHGRGDQSRSSCMVPRRGAPAEADLPRRECGLPVCKRAFPRLHGGREGRCRSRCGSRGLPPAFFQRSRVHIRAESCGGTAFSLPRSRKSVRR